jgi:uncharacterized membrane protein YagU involved in acid resistance
MTPQKISQRFLEELKMATTAAVKPSVVSGVKTGIVAGLGGGVVFGMLMAMMNMLPMVAGLVKSDSPVVGLIVHLGISAFIGAVYGAIANRLPSRGFALIVVGAVYGMIWWVLGALIAMPILLGMSQLVFQIGQSQIMSLMGHAIYGIVTVLLFVPLSKRL